MSASSESRGTGKRSGKTEFAGRRRATTRTAGFKSHPDSTGGEIQRVSVSGWHLEAGASLLLEFVLPATARNTLLGFGGWFLAPASAEIEITDVPGSYVLTKPAAPDWSKFGSQWYSDGSIPQPIQLRLTAREDSTVALYGVAAGVVEHPYLDNAPVALMKNKHQIAPEANFFSTQITPLEPDPTFAGSHKKVAKTGEIVLKSCNRCARFLPININNERLHLSFSNHCVAPHRRPCSHPGFGRLRNVDTDKMLRLEYGFQLECRFCKKFEVNAAHNPQRSAAQMKEDGARRRAFELLLTDLYGGSAALLYRRETNGRELADDVWTRFEGRCFRCGKQLGSPKSMHLDHTRPLALLWPLDGTATALCATHNSEKRDQAPTEYYDLDELERLAEITGLKLSDLVDPSPNVDAIKRLQKRQDWFFGTFLQRDELQTVRDGKLTADLLVKALKKALGRTPGGAPFDIDEAQAKWERAHP